jgi:hypothetical protein
MPLDRPLPDEHREALKMLWSVSEEQQVAYQPSPRFRS